MNIHERRLFKHVKNALPHLPDKLILKIIPKLSIDVYAYKYAYEIHDENGLESIRHPLSYVSDNGYPHTYRDWCPERYSMVNNYCVYYKNDRVYEAPFVSDCMHFIQRFCRNKPNISIEPMIFPENWKKNLKKNARIKRK